MAAAREYGAIVRVHDDEIARRQLTDLLYDARQTEDGAWRVRKRSTDVDLTARIERSDGRLAVVTHTATRSLNSGGRRG